MALSVSLFLIAIGAIFTFAVTATVSGVDINTLGLVLMAVGGIGVLISLLFLASFAPFYRGERTYRGERVVERDY